MNHKPLNLCKLIGATAALLFLGGCSVRTASPAPSGIIGLIVLILNIVAIVEIVKTNRDTGWKILWVILILLLPIIGLILYYLIGRKS